jgi:hypothetical protein
LVCLGPFICFERDPKECVQTEHLRETLESFAATSSLSDTFSQRLNRKAWANHSAVLKPVGNRFGHAVDANGHAINSRVDHVLGQGIARKPDEAQPQTVDEGLSRFAVDGHAILARACRKNGGIWDRLLR